jgi:hypothetical protein
VNCRNARKFVFQFIDGIVDDTKRLELEKHLSQCPACDKLASGLTRTMDLLHRAPQEKTSENFVWNLRMRLNRERNAVQERSQSYGSVLRSWNVRYAATAIAAFAVVLAAGLLAVNSGLSPVVPSQNMVAGSDTGPADSSHGTAVDKPYLLPGNSPFERLVDGGGSTAPGPVSYDGRIIDSPPVMKPAQIDSLLGVEIQSLTTEQKLRYMQILSQHFARRYQTEVINYQNR